MPSFLGGFSRLGRPEGTPGRQRTQSESAGGVAETSIKLTVTSDSETESSSPAPPAPRSVASNGSMNSRRQVASNKPMDRHALSSYYQRRSMTEDDQAFYATLVDDLQTPTAASPAVSAASPRSRPSTLATIPSERATQVNGAGSASSSAASLSGAQQVKERYMTTAQPSSPNLNGAASPKRVPMIDLDGQPEPTLPPMPPIPAQWTTSPKPLPAQAAKEKGRSPWRRGSKAPDTAPTAVAIAASASNQSLRLPTTPKMRRIGSKGSVRSGLNADGTVSTNGDARGRHTQNSIYAHDGSDLELSDSEVDDASRLILDEDAMPVTGFAVASSKRNIEFHEMFPTVPPDDYLIEDYGCALQREILVQGRLYISENHLCFHANIFGWVSNEVIPFLDVMAMEKKMTALIIPNAIQVLTKAKSYTFASFMGRDTAFDVMHNIWRLARPAGVESPTRGSLDDVNGASIDLSVSMSGAGGSAAVRRATTCQCGDNKEHYSVVCMDTTFPGEPDKIYNLLFASGFAKEFLRDEQKLMDLQISDWTPLTPGSSLLTRNMSYIKPLNGSIGPKQTRCELRDEMIHYDPDRYITMLTTTRTPEVPSGSAFSVKSRTCITWAGACATRVVVTSSVEWTGSSFIKGIITSSAMDGQKRYNADLEPSVRRYIEEHRAEFVPEGMEALPEPEILASSPVSITNPAGELPTGQSEHDERWLQWALDTFRGASKVAQQSFTGALELLWDVPLDTRAILLIVILILVATNVASLLAVRNHNPPAPTTNAPATDRGSEVGDTLRTILDEMRRAGSQPPALAPDAASGDWRTETGDIARTLDALEERVRRLRLMVQDGPRDEL